MNNVRITKLVNISKEDLFKKADEIFFTETGKHLDIEFSDFIYCEFDEKEKSLEIKVIKNFIRKKEKK